MEKQNMNDLINKVKSNNQNQVIQKVIPVEKVKTEEVQFSFYLEKEMLKKIKLKALENETSIKNLINTAIKKYIT